MKCISIKQPWAWLILNGGKDLENRTWNTKYRGPLLIHAGRVAHKEALGSVLNDAQYGIWQRGEMKTGAIIGIVDLVDVITPFEDKWERERSRWREADKYSFVLKNPRSFAPIPYRGRLNLFDVPNEIIKEVLT